MILDIEIHPLNGEPLDGIPYYTNGIITHRLVAKKPIDLLEQRIKEDPNVEWTYIVPEEI